MALLLAADGPATKLIADYRQFLDDWLEETYSRPVRQIHQIAPHQFVSFRMTATSDPLWERDDLNYQFEGLARAVDFLAPESYGQLGQPDGELAILFRIALGRALAPEQPIIWAETGMSVWNLQAQADDPERAPGPGRILSQVLRSGLPERGRWRLLVVVSRRVPRRREQRFRPDQPGWNRSARDRCPSPRGAPIPGQPLSSAGPESGCPMTATLIPTVSGGFSGN